MKVKIILNPYANRWGAKEKIGAVEAAFTAVNLNYDLTVTEKPTVGIAAAKTAVSDGYDAVVAAGGDGTISEVVNGLVQANPDSPTIPLGIVPIGSANDFNKMVALPDDIAEAVQVIAAGKTRRIDVGEIRLSDRVHYFNNNSAVAMEPMITLEHIKISRISGELRYYVALLKGIIKLKAWQMRIAWDDGGYEGPTYLLSVCNSPRTGGFMMAPGALVDDGQFDFVLAPKVSKGTVLAILFRLLGGKHIHHPKVTFTRTSQLTVTSEPGTPIHADGEMIGERETAVSYRVLPQKITLLTA
ncbi:MAG: diacylglycerol kinase family lipid kinase [Chloroflexi bacterium]|nr:diacylglycerol kinase family lipid kinase [Chloroflexota bacterium]